MLRSFVEGWTDYGWAVVERGKEAVGFGAAGFGAAFAPDVTASRAPSVEATRGPPAQHAVIRWPTGSGKTMAFSLPLLARLDPQAYGSGLQALVLAALMEKAHREEWRQG